MNNFSKSEIPRTMLFGYGSRFLFMLFLTNLNLRSLESWVFTALFLFYFFLPYLIVIGANDVVMMTMMLMTGRQWSWSFVRVYYYYYFFWLLRESETENVLEFSHNMLSHKFNFVWKYLFGLFSFEMKLTWTPHIYMHTCTLSSADLECKVVGHWWFSEIILQTTSTFLLLLTVFLFFCLALSKCTDIMRVKPLLWLLSMMGCLRKFFINSSNFNKCYVELIATPSYRCSNIRFSFVTISLCLFFFLFFCILD